MKPTALAWMAGIIDGEGSVMLLRQHAEKMTVPVVSVSSTTREILEECQRIAGGSIRTVKTYQDHHKPSWVWDVRYNRALSLLGQVLPYMHERKKIARANLLLSKYKTVTKRNGKYTDEERVERLAFDEEFRAL